jgi:Mg-chelatase subunit ChlD
MANDFNVMDSFNASPLRRLRPGLVLVALLALMSIAPTIQSAELSELVQDYRSKRQGLSKLTKSSKRTSIQSEIAPILLKIGEKKTLSAFKFLEAELASAKAELLPAVASGLLATRRDGVVPLLLRRAYAIGGPTKIEILNNVSRAPCNYRPDEGLVLRVFRSEKSLLARRPLIVILAKIDSLASAKALLGGVRTVKGKRKRDEIVAVLNDETFQALKVKHDPEAREWLAGEAFDKAPRAQTLLLLRLAEAEVLVDARVRVIALLKDRDREIAEAACNALRRLGIGDEVGALIDALENVKSWDRRFQIMALDTLASLNDTDALEAVLRVAHSGDVDLRTLALGSLRHGNHDVRSLDTLLAALRHSTLQVRNAALTSLSAYRNREVVGALVEFLGREKIRRLRVEASRLLARMTGQDFGLELQDWTNWWEIVKDKFDVAAKPESKTFVRRPQYFGLEVSAENIAFVVDISGSMNDGLYGFRDVANGDSGGRKIEVLKSELVGIIRNLPESSRVNIVPFHQIVMPWRARLQPLKSGGRDRAISFVEKLAADGETNIYDALEFALKDKDVEAVYLLSDGMPTRGQFLVPEDVLSNIQLTNRIRGVKIHCIGFGMDSHLLKALSRDSGGQYRMIGQRKAGSDAKPAPEPSSPQPKKASSAESNS